MYSTHAQETFLVSIYSICYPVICWIVVGHLLCLLAGQRLLVCLNSFQCRDGSRAVCSLGSWVGTGMDRSHNQGKLMWITESKKFCGCTLHKNLNVIVMLDLSLSQYRSWHTNINIMDVAGGTRLASETVTWEVRGFFVLEGGNLHLDRVISDQQGLHMAGVKDYVSHVAVMTCDQ